MTVKITPKQKAFCEQYIIDCNGTQAAIRAGYSKKTSNEQAARLLAKVSVKKYIEELRADVKSEAIFDAITVREGLLREANYFGEGASHGARVAAWRELGKHEGQFYEKDNAQKNPIIANLNELPLDVQNQILEQLDAIIEKDELELGEKPKPGRGPLATH